jgi:phage terminase large subunit-like protein
MALARTRAPGNDYPATEWWHGLARPEQIPPSGDWRIFMALAGRGWGKTRSIVEWAIEQARVQPGSRGALVGATNSDVYKVLVAGESGFLAKASPDFYPTYNTGKGVLTFPNGSTVWTFSAEEPNRLRGPQHHWAICDELAAWQYPDAWDQLLFGLRLGSDPRVAIATTPRPTPLIKRLLADSTCVVVRGSTYDNAANLAPTFISSIVRRYEGTRLGRQELNAEVLDDTPGALWTRDLLEANRVMAHPDLKRIVIGLDPSASSNDESDETGIIAAGLGVDGHGYILEDATLIAEAEKRARAAVALYNKYEADAVVVEINNGGDWIPFAIRVVDKAVRVKVVHASRGKHTRAEPVAGLYEQHKVHHVGYHGALEDQLCSWTSASSDSPDRLDALVWALWELMLSRGEITHDSAPSVLSEYRG